MIEDDQSQKGFTTDMIGRVGWLLLVKNENVWQRVPFYILTDIKRGREFECLYEYFHVYIGWEQEI